jgi:heterodisulfide reductase subunit B
VPAERRDIPGCGYKKHGSDYQVPVVFHSQLIAVAFGMDTKKGACLGRNTIRSEKLEKMARKG